MLLPECALLPCCHRSAALHRCALDRLEETDDEHPRRFRERARRTILYPKKKRDRLALGPHGRHFDRGDQLQRIRADLRQNIPRTKRLGLRLPHDFHGYRFLDRRPGSRPRKPFGSETVPAFRRSLGHVRGHPGLRPPANYALSCVLLGLTGFATISFSTSTNATIQLASDDERRGRVMSIYSLVFGGVTPIGACLPGPFPEIAGPACA